MSKKQSINPATAAIAGLAVGAAAGAAATALSDKNTRKKLDKKLTSLNKQTHEVYDKATKKLDTAMKSAEPKVREGINKLRKSTPDEPQQKIKARRRGEAVTEDTVNQMEETAVKGGEVAREQLKEDK